MKFPKSQPVLNLVPSFPTCSEETTRVHFLAQLICITVFLITALELIIDVFPRQESIKHLVV